MTEQQENEKICEWLGWRRVSSPAMVDRWVVGPGHFEVFTPTFRTGNDMHFMLHRLQALPAEETLEARRHLADCLLGNRFSPYQVRAAVLASIGEK